MIWLYRLGSCRHQFVCVCARESQGTVWVTDDNGFKKRFVSRMLLLMRKLSKNSDIWNNVTLAFLVTVMLLLCYSIMLLLAFLYFLEIIITVLFYQKLWLIFHISKRFSLTDSKVEQLKSRNRNEKFWNWILAICRYLYM